ncbi:MAG: PEP-CTERM sorting domain-containing protein, partial [Bryobacteraceae bacterium]
MATAAGSTCERGCSPTTSPRSPRVRCSRVSRPSTAEVIPEPETLALVGLGLAALAR